MQLENGVRRLDARVGSPEAENRRTDLAFLDFVWARRTLTRAGIPIKLTPKETLVLGVLLANAGNVVSTGDLITAGWGDEPVGPESLNRCLSGLRRKVPTICDHLRTHHRLGYCLAIDVRRVSNGPDERSPQRAQAVVRSAERLVGLQSAECCIASLRVLRNALENGVESPEIHAAIAEVEYLRVMNGHVAPRSGCAAAVSAAKRVGTTGILGARALSVVGMLNAVINRDLDSLALLDQARAMAPEDHEIAFRRVYAYASLGRAPEPPCFPDLTGEDFMLGDDFTPRSYLGVHKLIAGRIEEAQDIVRQGIALFPYDHRVLLLGALLETQLGDHETAIEYGQILRQTRSRGSGHAELLLAFLLHRGGYVEEASTLLETTMADPRSFRPSAFAVLALQAISGSAAADAMLERAQALGCPHVDWLLIASGARNLGRLAKAS